MQFFPPEFIHQIPLYSVKAMQFIHLDDDRNSDISNNPSFYNLNRVDKKTRLNLTLINPYQNKVLYTN